MREWQIARLTGRSTMAAEELDESLQDSELRNDINSSAANEYYGEVEVTEIDDSSSPPTPTEPEDDVKSTPELAEAAMRIYRPHEDLEANREVCNRTPPSVTGSEEAPLVPGNEFESTVRFCVYIGKAAHRYGSPGSKIEAFLGRLFEDHYGYHLGIFRSTQEELLCSVCETEEDIPRVIMIPIQNGLNLNKLGLLSDLVEQVLTNRVSQVQALAKMKAIDATPDPWGILPVSFCYVIVGGGLTAVLGGSWWDVLVGATLGSMCAATVEGLPRLGARLAQWVPLVASFVCSTMASAVKLIHSDLNVVLVTLSAIAILLPGYTVSMGIQEIVSNRIISGAAGLVGGMVAMVWLVIGASLGDALIDAIATIPSSDDDDDALDESYPNNQSIAMAWQILFVPLLCLSLNVVFQVSRKDFVWSILHLELTYLVFFVTGYYTDNGNLGVFLSTFVSSVTANAWATYKNRPNSILLVPSLVLQVSGSIGFQGLINIVDGNKSVGTEQFTQMIIVALLIVAGLLTGNTILEPSTTL